MNILRHSVQVQSAPGTCTCVSIFLLESERGFRLPVDVVFALRKSLFSITQRLSRKKCLSALTKTISPLVLGQKKKRERDEVSMSCLLPPEALAEGAMETSLVFVGIFHQLQIQVVLRMMIPINPLLLWEIEYWI